MSEREGLEAVIADIDERLAKLKVGGGLTKPRRQVVERWCAAHLNGVRAVAVAALATLPDDAR